jgi:hypothetical protein
MRVSRSFCSVVSTGQLLGSAFRGPTYSPTEFGPAPISSAASYRRNPERIEAQRPATTEEDGTVAFEAATNLADLYDLPLVDWSAVTARLREGLPQAPGDGGPDRHTCWLVTLNVDGSPHMTAVGALWVDDAFWFETGDRTRKARNVARDPRCTLGVATHEFDLVVEGDAHRVTDPATVAAMAERWAAQGWPCRVDESGRALTAEFSAPSAGPPPWFVYRITPRAATALATVEPGGATRWRF